jgi:hypothetical protein
MSLKTLSVILLFQAIVSLDISVPEVTFRDNSLPDPLSATMSQESCLFTSLSWTALSLDNSLLANYEQSLAQDIKCVLDNSELTFFCQISPRTTLVLLCPRQLYHRTALSFLVLDNFVPGQLVDTLSLTTLSPDNPELLSPRQLCRRIILS